MDTTTTTTSTSQSANTPPSKRLQFDRRYGWIFDEWKDPSQEALAGGRGMFCIVPLAKGLITVTSQSINIAADTTMKVLERHDQLSPPQLLASFNDQLQRFITTLKKPDLNVAGSKRKLLSLPAASSSLHSITDTGKNLQEA